jgi:hypothetical protein
MTPAMAGSAGDYLAGAMRVDGECGEAIHDFPFRPVALW